MALLMSNHSMFSWRNKKNILGIPHPPPHLELWFSGEKMDYVNTAPGSQRVYTGIHILWNKSHKKYNLGKKVWLRCLECPLNIKACLVPAQNKCFYIAPDEVLFFFFMEKYWY